MIGWLLIHYEKLKTTCAVLINNNRQFLLIKRARDPFKNAWAFVSGIGGSKKGLAPKEAAKDKVWYDLKTVFDGKYLFSLPVDNDAHTDEILVFQEVITLAVIRPNPEVIKEFGWFTKKEIKNLGPLAFEHNIILEKIEI